MTRSARRRRGALLLALALASGGLASSRVERRERGIEARVGEPVPVVVAAADLRQGARIGERQAAEVLAVRQVPAQFAPPDALGDPQQAVGATLAAPVAAGGYLTAGAIAAPSSEGDESQAALAPGQRAVQITAAGGEELANAGPGALVDVVVTTERAEGRGRTYLALERVELLDARPAPEGAAREDGAPATLATLRVTLRQAVFLAAAQTFAREIRLLLRAPAERRRSGPLVVDSGAL
ncbi:MAG TPA: Flp pilus assembly protein CpaB [Thermoleophilaceae bacterium]|jgi:pilus assembly protein CpaB